VADFDLMELISAPIIAMNEAESDNAARFVELLNEFAFRKNEDTGESVLEKLKFSFDRVDPDGQTRTQNVEIPLIHFLPIGGIAIDQATLNYALKLDPQGDTDPNGKLRLKGRLADSSEKETGLSGNVNIEIKLKQIDLPQGVLSMLETTQSATVQTEKEKAPQEPLPIIPDDFVSAQLLELAPRYIEAGQDNMTTILFEFDDAVLTNQSHIDFELSSWPKSALEFEDKNTFSMTRRGKQQIQFLASPIIEEYSSKTDIKLRILARVRAADGDIKEQQISIFLPRSKDAETRALNLSKDK